MNIRLLFTSLIIILLHANNGLAMESEVVKWARPALLQLRNGGTALAHDVTKLAKLGWEHVSLPEDVKQTVKGMWNTTKEEIKDPAIQIVLAFIATAMASIIAENPLEVQLELGELRKLVNQFEVGFLNDIITDEDFRTACHNLYTFSWNYANSEVKDTLDNLMCIYDEYCSNYHTMRNHGHLEESEANVLNAINQLKHAISKQLSNKKSILILGAGLAGMVGIHGYHAGWFSKAIDFAKEAIARLKIVNQNL